MIFTGLGLSGFVGLGSRGYGTAVKAWVPRLPCQGGVARSDKLVQGFGLLST